MKKIGLFFGSFNPIHIGHWVIAEFMVEQTDLDNLWFVVSPQNPLKEKKSLLADHHRWAMVNLAIEPPFPVVPPTGFPPPMSEVLFSQLLKAKASKKAEIMYKFFFMIFDFSINMKCNIPVFQ